MQISCEQVQTWKWETKAKGTFLSYFMVFSDNASFGPPVAYVLITSKHDGLVYPVE